MSYPERKAPFEDLTTIDERVDFVHGQVNGLQVGMDLLLEKEGLPPMSIQTREVPLRATVPLSSGVRIWKPSPLTGRIKQIIRHWPAGTNALVDLAVGRKDVWIMPNEVDTFVALDDATPVVTVDEPIAKGEELWAVINNHDGGNPHTITVTFVIEGVE